MSSPFIFAGQGPAAPSFLLPYPDRSKIEEHRRRQPDKLGHEGDMASVEKKQGGVPPRRILPPPAGSGAQQFHSQLLDLSPGHEDRQLGYFK